MTTTPDETAATGNGEPVTPDSPDETSAPVAAARSAIEEIAEPAMPAEEIAAIDAEEGIGEIDPELQPLRERLLAARDVLASRTAGPGQEEQFEDELTEIDEALRRIDEGAYGVCEYSGDPIPRERLAAMPWTRFTRESQDKLERDGRKLPQVQLPPDFDRGTPRE